MREGAGIANREYGHADVRMCSDQIQERQSARVTLYASASA